MGAAKPPPAGSRMNGIGGPEARPTVGFGAGSGLRACRGGFTLTELLVVIGIAVLLMAMAVPVGRSLSEGNRIMTCKAQLRQIGQALKMYHADEGGMPPFYINADENPDTATPYTSHPNAKGLLALYDTRYLSKEMTLHCPRDEYTATGDADFFKSYMIKDDDAAAATELNKFPYLPHRGVWDSTDPDYRRQLMRGPTVDPAPNVSVPVVDRNWHPADDTVVTWCPFHRGSVSVGGMGQYQVLFWDGSVMRVGEDVMTDGTIGPDEAWKVSRADASGG